MNKNRGDKRGIVIVLLAVIFILGLFIINLDNPIGLAIYEFVNENTTETNTSIELTENQTIINETLIEENYTIIENKTNVTEVNITLGNITDSNSTLINITSFNANLINETNITLENITEINITNITEIPTNLTINITNITISNITSLNENNLTILEEKPLHKVVIKQPVRWAKKILPNETTTITEIPREADNITVKKTLEGIESKVDEDNIMVEGDSNLITGAFIFDFFKEVSITGLTIYDFVDEEYQTPQTPPLEEIETKEITIKEEADELVIEYTLPGPEAVEENLSSGKKITIYSELNYTDILAFMIIQETSKEDIKFYHVKETGRELINSTLIDTNNNSLIDYIEWIVPHLSNQTYEVVIEISKAEHLNENREFIEDIYPEVSVKDDIWKEIPANNYIRVTFEIPLTQDNDIIIFARSNNSGKVEVYEKDSDIKIADFGIISNDESYKIFLTNLTETQTVFDLKVIGNSIEFDYIVDPPTIFNNSLSGAVNDVFIYDCNSDDSCSAGWRCNSSLSWYNSSIGPTQWNWSPIIVVKSSHASYPKTNIVDGAYDTGTGGTWYSANGDPLQWGIIDYGQNVTLRKWNMHYNSGYHCKNYTLWGGYDNSTWISLVNITNNSAIDKVNSFTDPLTYQYWKFNCTDSQSATYLSVKEFDMIEQKPSACFPNKTAIIANSNRVDLIDLNNSELWATFIDNDENFGTSNIILARTTDKPVSVYALNGKIYTGMSGLATDGGIFMADYPNDGGRGAYTLGDYLWDGNLSQKNDWTGFSTGTHFPEPSNVYIEDIYVKDIGSVTYIATAHSGGVTVINISKTDESERDKMSHEQTPDSRAIAVYIDDNDDVIYHNTTHLLRKVDIHTHNGQTFTPDNTTLLYNITSIVASTTEIFVGTLNNVSIFNSVTFSLDRTYAISGATHNILAGNTNNITSLALSPDNTTLYVGTNNGSGGGGVTEINTTSNLALTNWTSGNNENLIDYDVTALSTYSNPGCFYNTNLCNWTLLIGTDSGTTTVITELFSNSAPSHTTPILNSTSLNNLTSENLTVYNQSTSDPYGDDITNIIDWRLNGTSIAVLNMPFETNRTGETGSTIRDYSTYENNGTFSSNPTWNSSGLLGGAYVFDGTDDHIVISDDDVLSFTDGVVDYPFSISAWIFRTASAQFMSIINKYTTGNLEWTFYIDDGNDLNLGLSNSDASGSIVRECATPNVPTNQWVHVVAVYNGNETSTGIDLYQNGVECDDQGTDTTYTGMNNTVADVWIGEINKGGDEYEFKGLIDELMVFNRTLTKSQILNLYNNRTDEIHFNETSYGDSWSACLTPNDATGDGTTLCSANLTIKSPPSHITPILNSTSLNNLTSENLTVYNQSTSDSEGDDITNIIDWRLNGTSIAVLNMPFDTNRTGQSGSVIRDYSIVEHNGTGVNYVWEQSCISGGCYNGSSGRYVDMGDVLDFNNDSTFTFMAWIKSSDSTNQNMFSKMGATFKGYQFYIESAGDTVALDLINAIAGTNYIIVYGATDVTDGTWHHTAITYDGSGVAAGVNIYVDGIVETPNVVGDGLTGDTLTTTAFHVGNRLTSSNEFIGNIDEILIFNRTLTPNQISNIYNNYTNQMHFNETSYGDGWSACITPNDALYDGPTLCSTNLTIKSPPSHITPILNSSSGTNLTSENLTVYNQSTSDLDGDDITNIIDWRMNGTSIAVLNMPFDTNRTGQTGDVVRDYGTLDNNGTIQSNPIWNSTGYLGGAYEFDGTDDYIQTDNTLDTNLPHSYMAWVKANSWDSADGILGKYANGDGSMIWSFPANKVGFYVESAGYSTTVAVDTWYHVALVYNGTETFLYVNGLLNGSLVRDISNENTNFVMGTYSDGAGGHFNGTIDEVLIFNRTLTPNQIFAIYENRTNELSFNETLIGENWSACITPNDAAGDGTTLCSTNLTIVDNAVPTFSNAANGTGIRKKFNITMNLTITDPGRLSSYIFSWNDTGFWANDTAIKIPGQTSVNANVSKNITANATYIVSWRYYANDTNNNWGDSGLYNFTVNSTAPAFYNISYEPNTTAELDPNVNVTFNVTVIGTLTGGVVYLQYSNSTVWTNKTMTSLGNDIYQANLTLSSADVNYTFNIWANETLGAYSQSDDYVFNSSYDCTWYLTSTDLSQTAGFDENKYIGNITAVNTGDSGYYLSSCSLSLRFTHTLAEGRVYFNDSYLKPSDTIVIPAQANHTTRVNGSFLSEIKEEDITITVDEVLSRSNESSLNVSATMVSTVGGPYLYERLVSTTSTQSLTFNNFTLEAYIRNLVGDDTATNTAHNVSFNWTLPSGFTVLHGSANVSHTNLSNSSILYNNINITFNSDNLASLEPGTATIYLYAFGYNSSSSLIEHSDNRTLLNESLTITLECYNVSDGVYVTACGSLDGDYTAPTTTTTTTSAGGGGGGGAASATESIASSADFQLVRGEENEIEISFKNRNLNKSLTLLEFKVVGKIAKYIEVTPTELDILGPGREKKITLKITSPTYISIGRQKITLVITGKLGTKHYVERKDITLEIHELSGEKAQELLDESIDLLKQLKDAGLSSEELETLLQISIEEIENFDYELVRDNHEIIKENVENALEAKNIIEELEKLIAKSKEQGIDTSGTERILKLAKLSLERADFEQALKRAKEAQITFAIEVKGEIAKIGYYLKNNSKEISITSIVLVLFGFASYKVTKLRLVRRKIKKLRGEVNILEGLMRVVQKETFKDKKMSMGEYKESMLQYEKKLSRVIERLINLEIQRAHELRFTSKQKKLELEREKILNLIKGIQTDYLKKRRIETHAYRLRLESYNRRLGEIDQKLATLEAKSLIKKIRVFKIFKHKRKIKIPKRRKFKYKHKRRR